MCVAPGGVHIVLEGKTQLIAVGYQYSGTTTLFFLLTKGAGSTVSGDPYEMKFTDSYGNIVICFVDHPAVMSTFSRHLMLLTPITSFVNIFFS
jgi:hypothetical protein